jgi:hypothetical protein
METKTSVKKIKNIIYYSQIQIINRRKSTNKIFYNYYYSNYQIFKLKILKYFGFNILILIFSLIKKKNK